jgi:hypothetical protein
MHSDHQEFVDNFDFDQLNASHVPGLQMAMAWAENIARINDFRLQLDVLLKLAKGGEQSKDSTSSANGAPSLAEAQVIPEGYCIMPRVLSAENGAKSLLLGEFMTSQTHLCYECSVSGEEPDDECHICKGLGTYKQSSPVEWHLVKDIYLMAMKGLALKPTLTADDVVPSGQ